MKGKEQEIKIDENINKGRVVCVLKNLCHIEADGEKLEGKVSGRFMYTAVDKNDYPVVGDYVMYRKEANSKTVIIDRVCERASQITRFDTFNKNKEVIVSNIDIIFVTMSLNKDFNITKLQNFLTLAYCPNVKIIILLTKKDLCLNVKEKINKVKTITSEYEICLVSIYDKESVSNVAKLIGQETAVFLGSSGVGKSALINELVGQEHFKTGEIRESDAQGKHTTTHREMLKLPNGGSIIDTPGIRHVLSYKVTDVDEYYEDVDFFAKDCKFRSCTHVNEIGCKVLEALEYGKLSKERYNSYLKVLKYNRFADKKDSKIKRNKNKKNNYIRSKKLTIDEYFIDNKCNIKTKNQL